MEASAAGWVQMTGPLQPQTGVRARTPYRSSSRPASAKGGDGPPSAAQTSTMRVSGSSYAMSTAPSAHSAYSERPTTAPQPPTAAASATDDAAGLVPRPQSAGPDGSFLSETFTTSDQLLWDSRHLVSLSALPPTMRQHDLPERRRSSGRRGPPRPVIASHESILRSESRTDTSDPNAMLPAATNASLVMRERSLGGEGGEEGAAAIERIGRGRPTTREIGRAGKGKREWVEEWRRQQSACAHLERDAEAVVKKLQAMGQDGATCLNERNACSKARADEAKKLTRGLRKVGMMAGRMQSELQHVEKDDQYLRDLRALMDTTEAEIVNYKNDQRRTYELMRKTEGSLTRELELFTSLMGVRTTPPFGHTAERRLSCTCHTCSSLLTWPTRSSSQWSSLAARQGWDEPAAPLADQPPPTRSGTPGSSNGSIRNRHAQTGREQRPASNENMVPEVSAFEDYVGRHGHNGGWDALAHQEFLSVWLRHARNGSRRQDHHMGSWHLESGFIEAVLVAVPSATAEFATDHAVWYRQYTDMLDAKRAAVKLWRIERDERAAERRKVADASPGTPNQQICRGALYELVR